MYNYKNLLIAFCVLAGVQAQILGCCCSDNRLEERQDAGYSDRVVYATLLMRKGLMNAHSAYFAAGRDDDPEYREIFKKGFKDRVYSSDFAQDMDQQAEDRAPGSGTVRPFFAIDPERVINVAEQDMPVSSAKENDRMKYYQIFLRPEHKTPLSRAERAQLATIRKAFVGEQQLWDLERMIQNLDPKNPDMQDFRLTLPCFMAQR